MKALVPLLFTLTILPAIAQAQTMDSMNHTMVSSPERLGTVNFAVSCAPETQPAFNRGVALLHDFWYEEAQQQFADIAKSDPACAMAHWGVAMSRWHQIWARPNEAASAAAYADLQQAQNPPAKTERERAYINALTAFFAPGKQEYQSRVDIYSAAMAAISEKYPDDVDAGALYALSLLAAEKPDDTSLAQERKAMAVLSPLWSRHPDNPGVDHYIIHACDNPAMAAEGLAAADHYGEIAPSGAHAYHMPGHIYARLGMWPQDIKANLGSVAAAESAEANHKNGLMDEPHAYDFLLYAYLQSGQDERARWVLDQSSTLLNHLALMSTMHAHREGMVPYYRTEMPAFYALETRDWKSAAALLPAAGSPPEVATLAYWARSIGDGHLRLADAAKADLAQYDALILEVKKGKNAYRVESIGAQITREEMVGWVAFASGQEDDALKHMRVAADLQDKVGQMEVDIPAREMLADMLLELHQPQLALNEYQAALTHSPNRFNALFHAGMAAEAAGNPAKAGSYYSSLLKSTDNGTHSSRPEFTHIKNFVASSSSPQQSDGQASGSQM